MDMTFLNLETFQKFLICTARIAALVGSLPVFRGNQTPMRFKAALAISFTLVLFPLVVPVLPDIPFEPFTLGVLLAKEVLLGLMVGFTAGLIFTAIEFGGTVIGYQMGFAAANVFDPQNQSQIPLISQFQNVIAVLIFLAVGGHHMLLRAMVESFSLLPPGTENFSQGALTFLVERTSAMFVLGVQLSAPILAVLLLSGLIMGVMSRVFPQLNVFMLSYPINIGLAFIVMGLTINSVAGLLGREFVNLGGEIMTLFSRL